MFRTSKFILVCVLIATTLRGNNFGQMNFAYWQSVAAGGVVASGGTQATPANGYNQWSFLTTGSNTFTVTSGGTVYYAIVAGGGGGGGNYAGGGGGGGIILGQTTLTAGTYTIVVGVGGTGGTFANFGGNGGNSSAFGYTAVGGGGGGRNDNISAGFNGLSGGSGGGGAAGTITFGGVGVAGQGWAGGGGLTASPYPSGGGGGAGGIGATGSGSQCGNGGIGLGIYLPVSNSTVYYGGGGGGGSGGGGSSAILGSGGTGGGGNGSVSGSGSAGTANTGGGGGGGGAGSSSYSGGAGGSGIVVIWSPIATPAKTPYVQYLAVAGGGGGGSNVGGGGGAGGLLQGIAQITSGATYTITVGSGGTGGTTSTPGQNGVNSTISGTGVSITAIGGGGGGNGYWSQTFGSNGGSGGGGGNYGGIPGLGGTGTLGQGYGGGKGNGVSPYSGGGGGGFGMYGADFNGNYAGNGGDGYTTYIVNPATYSWSNHFNSNTTDYLSVPSNTAFAFGTGAFTVEMWAYFTSSGSNIGIIDTGNSTGINIRETGTNALMVYSRAGSAIICTTGSNVFSLNTWTHIALVRNGTTDTLYVNGVSQATGSDSNSYGSAGALIVGVFMDAISSTYCINGYLSNLRIVKGTAVYTSGFTPSTTPLTAISGTSLLTCQAGSFSDSSSNNFTVTASGSPYIASQNPFGSSYAGGGGGAVVASSGGIIGQGGMGGGGAGAGSGNGINGSTNTGGGGGSNYGTTGNGVGGSGVVILAYPSTFPAASSVTGSPTVTTTSGYRVYTFTGGGTITF